MGHYLTEEQFKPFGDALGKALGDRYVVEYLPGNAPNPDPAFLLACKVTLEGNEHPVSIVSALAVVKFDPPSIERWVKHAKTAIRKKFGIIPQKRI